MSAPVEGVVTDFHGRVTVRRGPSGRVEVHCEPIINFDGREVRVAYQNEVIIRETDNPSSLEMEVLL